jgi:DNA replication and repair protein RecF
MEFARTCNVIVGPNGSGKTSVLEAIFLLGSGHSFRCHRTDTLIRVGTESFQVVGKVDGPSGQEVLGIQGSVDAKEFRIHGRPVRSAAELALQLPVQAIDPEVHRLIEDGPTRRRRFLDWGVFHVEPRFHGAWRRYHKALRQRNAAFRSTARPYAHRIWDQELIEQGDQIAAFRDSYLEGLHPFVFEVSRRLLGEEVVIEHQRGWRRNQGLAEALAGAEARDMVRAGTSVGPHRADLVLKIAGVPVRDRISRGQQKILACVLILAQQLYRASTSTLPACLLLDDPAAELDVDNLRILLNLVTEIPAQLIITALSTEALNCLPKFRLFHVEHGNIRAMA